MTNGAAKGYVLQSDASGNGQWVSPASSVVVAGTGLSYSNDTLNSPWTINGNNINNNNSGDVGINTGSPTSTLDVSGSFAGAVKNFTTSNNDYQLTSSDFIVIFTGRTTNNTIIFPAAKVTGRIYYIVNETSTAISTDNYYSGSGTVTTNVPAGTNVAITNDGTGTFGTWRKIN